MHRFAALLASSLLLACGGAELTPDDTLPPEVAETIDRCEVLADEFPSSACYYLDGGRNMFLFTAGTSPEVRRAVVSRILGRPVVDETYAPARRRYHYREVEFGYGELMDARRQGSAAVHSVEAVHMYGVNVIENRVEVGIDDEAARASVEAAWTEHGLPLEILSIQVKERVGFFTPAQE